MALNAKKVPSANSGPRAPVLDEGAYPARLVAVIDLGLQPQRDFKGEAKPPKYEIQTIYESSDEFMPDEEGNPDETKPRWFWDNFPLHNLKSDLATSTKRYYALDPKEEFGGDWSQLIGRPVIIALTRSKGKNDIEYNNVGGTSSMRPKEAGKLPELINDPKLFDLDDPDVETFLSLPDRIQEKIKNNLNYSGSLLEKRLAAHAKGEKTESDSPENPTKNTAPDVKSGAVETASPSDTEDGDW